MKAEQRAGLRLGSRIVSMTAVFLVTVRAQGESVTNPTDEPPSTSTAQVQPDSVPPPPLYQRGTWLVLNAEYAGITGYERRIRGEPQLARTAAGSMHWPFGLMVRLDQALLDVLSIGPFAHLQSLQTEWGAAVGMDSRWLLSVGAAPTLRLPYRPATPDDLPKLFYVIVPIGVTWAWTRDPPNFSTIDTSIESRLGYCWGMGVGTLVEVADSVALGLELGGRSFVVVQDWTLVTRADGATSSERIREQVTTFYGALNLGVSL